MEITKIKELLSNGKISADDALGLLGESFSDLKKSHSKVIDNLDFVACDEEIERLKKLSEANIKLEQDNLIRLEYLASIS